jgi:hypothetical protein
VQIEKNTFFAFLKESLKYYIRTGKPLLLKEFAEVEILKKAA